MMETVNEDLPTDIVVVYSSGKDLLLRRIDRCFDNTIKKEKHICSDATRNTYTEAGKSLQQRLTMYINMMGQKSAQAQGLKEPITSASKLIQSDHRLYVIKDASVNNTKGTIVGILKVGMKKLFLTCRVGEHAEVNPVCLLDFYVDDSRQRQGFGLRLFNVMLELEGVTPEQLAIDRPSMYLLNFLKKHYKLDQPQFHPNKYVVFPGFFCSIKGGSSKTVAPGPVRNHDPTKSHKDKDDEDEDVAHHITPYAPPPSPAAIKSAQGITYATTRYDLERKWQQMYDSWNVMGVPPRDYSYIKNARQAPLQSESNKTRVSQSVFPKPKYTFL